VEIRRRRKRRRKGKSTRETLRPQTASL